MTLHYYDFLSHVKESIHLSNSDTYKVVSNGNVFMIATNTTRLKLHCLWCEGCSWLLSERANQDRARNNLKTPGNHLDLELRYAWSFLHKYVRLNRRTFSLPILPLPREEAGMGEG